MTELVGLQKRIYEIVKRAYPNRVATGDLIEMLYANCINGEPEWAASSVKHQVYEINKKIHPHKISGKNGRASSGYIFIEHSEWDAMWSKPFHRPDILNGEA